MQQTANADGRTSLLAWLQLVRLPNVFTAPADVAAGWWLTHETASAAELFWLIAASCCLYAAGMALNDYFDVAQDVRERPHRPIPSGRVGRAAAGRFGAALLGLGLVAAAGAAASTGRPGPLLIAALLGGCVVAYDGPGKRTPLGPPLMGACRGLNVLLGASTAALPDVASGAVVWVALAMAIYIAGVTWFARREAAGVRRGELAASSVVLVGGLALLASLPAWIAAPVGASLWNYLSPMIGVLSAPILVRCSLAVASGSGPDVQRAVKTCILSVIPLNAAVVLAAAGPGPAIAVAALILPTMYLGRFLYST